MVAAESSGLKQKRAPHIDAIAGGFAGAVARFVVGPLDVLKIRFQVQIEPIVRRQSAQTSTLEVVGSKYTGLKQAFATVLREEGIAGLWRGTVPGLLLQVPYTAVQFVALQKFHAWADSSGLDHTRWAQTVSFASGAFAGAAATVGSYPFDLLRTTLAAQGEPKVYRGLGEAAQGIYQRAGLKGFYAGLSVTLLEIMPYAALQFGLYDMFTSAYKKSLADKGEAPDSKAHWWGRFLCGLAAGTIAKLATHPLDLAKKRFQIAGLPRSLTYGARVPADVGRSLPQCLRQIYVREGVRGLYKGSIPSILKAAPAAAVTFSAYEAAARVLDSMHALQTA